MNRWTAVWAVGCVFVLMCSAQAQVNRSDALAIPDETRSSEQCPPDALCGQDAGACGSNEWFFYSDLNFCTAPPTTCARVRCENFPPPGQGVTDGIRIIQWRGLYVDDLSNGCTKPQHLFRMSFYLDDNGAPQFPAYYSEYVLATAVPVRWYYFCFACNPTMLFEFTAVLDNPVYLTNGWFSIVGDGDPDCYFLWQGSAQGDNKFYQWSDTGGGAIPGPAVTDKCDLNYCFMSAHFGACCDDCSGTCTDNATDVYCAGIGGRFAENQTCFEMSPPCGQGLGACCHDDGTCALTLCGECNLLCIPCLGDMSCDGMIDFHDINPFVLYLSNFTAWQSAYPGCDPIQGDINCDGTYGQGSFGDINPFVQLMTLCGGGCPCPGPGCQRSPRNQGMYWAGPNTSCPADCCTIVVPPGAPHLEGELDNCAPDTFDGGCTMTTPLFSPIVPGWTVYGQSGTSGSYRDADWYQTTITAPRSFTVTVEAEFDVAISAYRAGPDPNSPCNAYRDIAAPVGPPINGHNQCTPVQLVTRCLPAGTYFFVVEPAALASVMCGSDYKITLETGSMCEVLNTCGDCSSAAYVEGTNSGDPGYCNDDPAAPDPNGGCDLTPPAFEPLPQNPGFSPDTFSFCGKLWSSGGHRDVDWWSLNLPVRAQVQWTVETEVLCRATLLFSEPATGIYAPPLCGQSNQHWDDTLYDPCLPKSWTGTMYYEANSSDHPYFFLVTPETASGPLAYGYPCPMGGVDLGNDYSITMTVTAIQCENEILAKTVAHVESELNCWDPLAYYDVYNSGCDYAYPPGPTLALDFGTDSAWRAQTFSVTDPNNPGAPLKKDYDWYQFTLTTNRRFKVYLYADGALTWEIWPANNCAVGPIEGLEVPTCFDAGVFTRRCYTPGTYWLRVYPTNAMTCGRYYYLALTEAGACAVCNFNASGSNLDDPCDDVNGYDTNAGCDNPSGPPPHYLPFTCGATYWGTIYAEATSPWPYYDRDWFTLTQTNTTSRRLKLTVTAEFLAHVEVYLSCVDYDNGNPVPGLDGMTPLVVVTGCPNVMLTATTSLPQGTVFYGRITCVDQFGNVMTKYYPCAKGNNRWKIITACIV